MIQNDVLVFDGVAHPFNFDPQNALGKPGAMFNQHLYAFHQVLTPTKVLGTPEGSAAPYFYVAELWFASKEQLQASMGSAEGREAAADLANFATGGTTILMSEITAEQRHV